MTPGPKPPAKPLVWGVLGAASIAVNRVIPAIQAAPGCHVGAIASRDLERARSAAFQLGIERAYGDYDELLADPDVEAVYIPLPNRLHASWCLKALEAGKHVLCEKPITLDAEEALQLLEARRRTGLVIEEAFAFPAHPQWDFIRETVRSGEIGELRAVTAVLAFRTTDPRDIRNNPAGGGGALYDLGCYAVNAARILFDSEPVKVMALMERDQRFGVDRMSSALLQFSAGHATLTVSIQAGPSRGGSHQHLGLLGSKGWLRAEFPFAQSSPTECRVFIGDAGSRGSMPARTVQFKPVNQYALQAARFACLARGEEVAGWSLEHSVGNMRTIDALFRSAVSGAWESP